MSHGKENDDKVFCSRECHIKVKTCRKNAMKDYAILRVLREHPDGLLATELSYFVDNLTQYQVNGAKISMLLKKWVSRGIVKKKNSSNRMRYHLNPKYLGEALGALVIKYQTPRPYAQSESPSILSLEPLSTEK